MLPKYDALLHLVLMILLPRVNEGKSQSDLALSDTHVLETLNDLVNKHSNLRLMFMDSV